MELPSIKKVAVIGQGYVGLPLAIEIASAGCQVIGLDVNLEVTKKLNSGVSHIEDIEQTRLNGLIATGLYSASSDFSNAQGADVIVICVPTPLDHAMLPDVTFLNRAIDSIIPYLSDNTLIINESTSYPGTLRELIIPRVGAGRKSGLAGLCFASAPERIDPRNSSWNLRNTPRVISGIDEYSTKRASSFYKSFCKTVIEVSSPEVAETAKLLENTFRQVNIALVNQLVPLCRKLQIDIRDVINAAASKPYGFMSFYPSAGVGGHCIPIDPLYLLWKARQLDLDLPLVTQADEVNKSMSSYVVSRLIDFAKPRTGDNIAILGVAYKAGLSDIRESPAINVAKQLTKFGFNPVWCDPKVKNFYNIEEYEEHKLGGAIIVTNQLGLPVMKILDQNVPILDCSGDFSAYSGIEQL